eukprot:3123731-Prymnesium_polylepis.1
MSKTIVRGRALALQVKVDRRYQLSRIRSGNLQANTEHPRRAGSRDFSVQRSREGESNTGATKKLRTCRRGPDSPE